MCAGNLACTHGHFLMRCYLIRDTRVTILHTRPDKTPPDAVLVESAKSLDANRFPTSRLLAIFNALPGASPVKRFMDRPSAIKRVWTTLEALPVTTSKTESKQACMLALLQRPEGASMAELITATGWQPHSIRGAFSAVLRKKLGMTVSYKLEKGRHVFRASA